MIPILKAGMMIANVQSDVDASNDENASYQFEIAGTGEGPESLGFIDAANEGCGISQMWLKTGISASTAFAFQWKEVAQSVTVGDFLRSFQIIEITAEANLLTAITSVSSHSLTGSYADVADLVDTVTVGSRLPFMISVSTSPPWQLFSANTMNSKALYLAMALARVSRMTMILICPGYSSSPSMRRLTSSARRAASASETLLWLTRTRTSRPAWMA